MKNVVVVDHPLVQHKLTHLRDKNTVPKDFKELLHEMSVLMAYEITKDIAMEEIDVETPLMKTRGKVVTGRSAGIVAILRAGLGMVDGVLSLIPRAKVGHIGLFRDPRTLRPVEYFTKLPVDISSRDVIIVDPMVATGYSAAEAIKILKGRGVKKIKYLSILSSPEGLKVLEKYHPDVKVFTASIDDRLNDHGYILPGLGDAGDRLFGTK